MDKPTIVFSPLQAGVPAAGGAVDVLVRVQAPDRPAHLLTQHQPKRLALVVDRSGSMNGEPLVQALRCVTHIARHLTPQDALALVVYDDKVRVLRPLAAMTSLDALQREMTGVISGGSTNLHAGWLAGASELAGAGDQAISRVILLSDGQANQGLTDQAEIEAECRQWLAQGVTTTTVGLGRGFNEDLMVGMARAGGGQNYYGQTAEDLYDSFDEELALLQALYLRNLGIKLIPAPGVVLEMLSPAVQQKGGSYRMTDLAWASESWLAVRLHMSASALGDQRDLLAASLSGTAMDGTALQVSAPLLQLPVVDSHTLAALPLDETAANRLLELEFAKASEGLRQLAREEDAAAVKKALAALEKRFGQHTWLSAKMKQLRRLAQDDMQMMAKEVHFSVMRMSRRLVARDEVQFGVDETSAPDIPAFLRKKVSEGRGREPGA